MTEDEAKRFSDERLSKFYTEFKNHEEKESEISKQLLECQRDLRASIDNLSTETRELIDIWHDAQGTVRIMSWLGKAIKWLSGVAVIGWVLTEIAKNARHLK